MIEVPREVKRSSDLTAMIVQHGMLSFGLAALAASLDGDVIATSTVGMTNRNPFPEPNLS